MRWLHILLGLHLFLVSLLPGANVRELTEVDQIRKHRQEHHANSSLLGFLVDHFLSTDRQHDNDRRAHDALPFHHAGCMSGALVYVLPAMPQWHIAQFELNTPEPVRHSPSVPAVEAGYSGSCWQPPQV